VLVDTVGAICVCFSVRVENCSQGFTYISSVSSRGVVSSKPSSSRRSELSVGFSGLRYAFPMSDSSKSFLMCFRAFMVEIEDYQGTRSGWVVQSGLVYSFEGIGTTARDNS